MIKALFKNNLNNLAWLFGGQAATFSRIIFTLVGLAGLWCISLLFRDRDETSSEISHM